MQECRNCHETTGSIVARDLRMDNAWTSGNPYQRRCDSCNSMLHAASKSEWKNADQKHVIPRGGDDPVPVNNEFDCPACEKYNHGHPDECAACGAAFNWD